LSGLAAGIRSARFGLKTLILEQHHLPGGLNSYYFRNGFLLETGLHAMTNHARPGEKRAPLNRLFRQLKLSRRRFVTHEQYRSRIVFPEASLWFSNDPSLLESEIGRLFPHCAESFQRMIAEIRAFDPFRAAPWRSSREFLKRRLPDPLLIDMLLLPLMVYGNSEEEDMDLAQFVIMFRAVFLEGFFRPQGTIRDFLGMLLAQYQRFDGEIRYQARVRKIICSGKSVEGVVLENGEEIRARAVLSTAGLPATIRLSGWPVPEEDFCGRMSFMETITLLPARMQDVLARDQTIVFYNHRDRLHYRRPDQPVDTSWGVICFPDNFQGLEPVKTCQVRTTNAANYLLWQEMGNGEYRTAKQRWHREAVRSAEKIIGNYCQDTVYEDCFTPLTIERFTAKCQGAVYGSPRKIRDGRTPWSNLFIAGTDQGFLGIVGAMLSGVSIVNQHLLQ